MCLAWKIDLDSLFTGFCFTKSIVIKLKVLFKFNGLKSAIGFRTHLITKVIVRSCEHMFLESNNPNVENSVSTQFYFLIFVMHFCSYEKSRRRYTYAKQYFCFFLYWSWAHWTLEVRGTFLFYVCFIFERNEFKMS